MVAFVGIFVLRADARYLFDGLTSRGLPLVILSALCGIGSLVLLVRHAHRGARLLAIGAVATVVWGWGVAQWPYVLPETLKVSQAAAPSGTLSAVLVVFVLAAVLILPSLGLLYYLDQKSLLTAESSEPTAVTVRPGADQAIRRFATSRVRSGDELPVWTAWTCSPTPRSPRPWRAATRAPWKSCTGGTPWRCSASPAGSPA